MSKFVLVLVVLSTLCGACGASSSRGGSSLLSAEIQLGQTRRYNAVMEAALDAYETELEEAANQSYATRAEALDNARKLGSEGRLMMHIRTALQAEGLSVDDLCHFASANPGYADTQRAIYSQRSERMESLLETIASAPLTPHGTETVAQAMDRAEREGSGKVD